MNRFEIVKYLGKGSYGSAILARRVDSGQQFVVKEILIGHLSKGEQASARQESEVLSQMSHSNIIQYCESFVENDKLYIVMEYADGGDLAAAIGRRRKTGRPFSEHTVMNIFVQISDALRHVHQRNILHRDIKSQNVFLTSRGVVKLGDFGIARILDSSGECAKTQIGSPYYLSPEICENMPYGKKSDVWSVGVILYELMALHTPFQGQSLPTVIHKILVDSPEPISTDYSQALKDLLMLMLNKRVEDRPSIKQVLQSDYVQNHVSKLLSFTIKKRDDEEVDVGNHGHVASNPTSPSTPDAVSSSSTSDSRQKAQQHLLNRAKPQSVVAHHQQVRHDGEPPVPADDDDDDDENQVTRPTAALEAAVSSVLNQDDEDDPRPRASSGVSRPIGEVAAVASRNRVIELNQQMASDFKDRRKKAVEFKKRAEEDMRGDSNSRAAAASSQSSINHRENDTVHKGQDERSPDDLALSPMQQLRNRQKTKQEAESKQRLAELERARLQQVEQRRIIDDRLKNLAQEQDSG